MDIKTVRHVLSFAPATLVSEAKIETGALIKTGARPCVEFWSSHSCECDKAVRTYSYYYRGRRRNLLCILRALCRRQFLEPEAERCGVGKLTMRRIILSFLFFHFPFLRVYFAKKHFCALFRLMQKNNSRYSFWSRHRKNTRKYTSPS